jgi:hypothetical protein
MEFCRGTLFSDELTGINQPKYERQGIPPQKCGEDFTMRFCI